MLYPHDIEEKIGFDRVRALLKGHCISTLAQEEIDRIGFSTDFDAIVGRLAPVDEAARLLADGVALPLGDTADLRNAFTNTRIEGTCLELADIDRIRRNCLHLQQVADFLRKTDAQRFPTLHRMADDCVCFPNMLHAIDAILDKFGDIKENASPELAQIRHDMRRAKTSVQRTLHAILRQAQADGLVEKEAAPTMRDGRLVIPVLAMNKRKIGGIVHDESATGKTAYIEPSAVVEANNRLRELEGDERREILRILQRFTDFVRPFYADLLDAMDFLARLDALQAKAKLARQTNAIKPHLKNDAYIDWYDARHPLLELSLAKQGKNIVPLNIRLSKQQRILLISGPNAGGKSVCLKTVGLLQYMLQCGLLVPIGERSEVGIFESIFIDIGDEQSIENDLSTYSSHLLNMKQCLRHCNGRSLLLVDEFGTGTEPQIGGALAEAMLDKFNASGTFGLITTHYTNLKHFAADTDGIANGAMLYDRHEMRPLFALQIGQPGSSFAIEIARKIGLPDEIIESATQKVGAAHIDYDKNLQDVARDKRYWANKRRQIHDKEKQIDALKRQYDEAMADIGHRRKEMLRQAKAEAADILAETNAKIEQTIRTIKETHADKMQTKKVRQQLAEHKAKLTEKPHKKSVQKPLHIGDSVRIVGQEIVGKVLEINDKTAIVAFGQIKSTVGLDRLEPCNASQSTRGDRPASNTTDTMHARQLRFKPEIDVRGMRVDEALNAVIYFIDDAEMLAAGRVRILHGTGTGALRQAIRDYLHNAPAVASYHDEHVQLGGAGITVVELK